MKATDKKKRAYTAPEIEHVKLDNEISLILESSPPVGPFESKNTPEYFHNDPFKSNRT